MDHNISSITLSTLYMQVQYCNTPSAILGLAPDAVEVRDTYCALALRIHPNKGPSDSLRELHTSLFK